MKLVKPMALSFTCRPLLLFGRQRLSVTSMVGFSLVEGERRLIPEIELWPAIANATGALVDEGLPKARGEALLFGSCHTPGARPLAASFVRLQLGTIDKKLSVIGDRYWQESAWKSPTTEPVPFTEMPLTWDRAFGGPDYAKNPLGRGIIEDGGKVPLPNIELGRGLISARSERPEPAGFGPLEVGWTQRIALAGSYDEKWLDDGFPGYARDADPAFFSMAPADQRIDGFFTGDEPFLLENMHPTRSKIAGFLPGIAARTFLRGRQQTFEEVKTRLDSVVFLAGLEMGILIFRGTADIEEDDAADISHAFAACEDSNAPRGVGHYQSAFERRIDKDESPLLALQDDELLPSFSSGSALAALLPSVAAKADAGATGARAAAEGRIRAELAARGMNAEALLAGAKARSAAELPELAELDALLASPDLSTSAGLSALEKGIRATIEATRKYSAAAVAKNEGRRRAFADCRTRSNSPAGTSSAAGSWSPRRDGKARRCSDGRQARNSSMRRR